jgi:ATP-binding cassette subfamily B protein/ATP-binding cassette subfamily C protein
MKPKNSGAYKNVLPVMRYFYGIAWRFKKSFFIYIVLNMLVTGFSPFINIMLPKYIIDELMGQKRVDMLVRYISVLVILNLIVLLIRSLFNYLNNRFNMIFSNKFDRLLADKALSMDFEHTENTEMLTQMEKAKTGMSWYSGGITGLTNNITAFISGIITFSGTVYIIGKLSPWLFAVLIAIIVINMVFLAKTNKLDNRFMKELVAVNRKFSYYFNVLKNFRFGKDIRIYNADGMIMNRTDKYIRDDWNVETERIRLQNRYALVTTFFSAAQQALLYGYLGIRVLKRLISIGDFQMLISAALSFSNSLSNVIDSVITIVKNADFMNDYREFMLMPDKMRSGSLHISAVSEHELEFRNVSFKYLKADKYSLKNIDITIPTSRKLSVVGQNGAGKTTFIKLLTRLYDPTEGEILLDGVDIREYDLEEYRRLFSVVFQDYRLFAFTIKENITAGSAEDKELLDEAIIQAGFEERLKKLDKGLDTAVYKSFDKDGVEFSGGESQKIALARAVYKGAPATVLDEPTAALDPMAEYDIYNRFNSLIGNKTAIYISHRLSSCRFCDNIAVFKDGEIVQFGPHDRLVGETDSEYYMMWSAQAKYYE